MFAWRLSLSERYETTVEPICAIERQRRLNMKLYTTIENQVRDDGSKGLLYDHYDDENQALAKF